MNIQENISLKNYNTFGLDAKARYFLKINTIEELRELVQSEFFKVQKHILILGGGSNILLTRDFDGLVVKISITGIDKIREEGDHVWLKAGAGENWHELVLYAIQNNLGGIENLSLIPGTVGAAPMQNIGAYGVEIKDVFEELEAVNIKTGELELFDNQKCEFGYRNSIFKQEAKGHYIIANITLKLSKKHRLNLEYGAIRNTLNEMDISDPDIKDVSDAVIKIRQSKLPNPAVIGNAGSFFKNPVVSDQHFKDLQKTFPDIPHYNQQDGVKVPAGWLIEQCGWKGKRSGNIGVHDKQALVLVNHGGGSGKDLKILSEEIQKSIEDKFGIKLETEVNFVY